MASGQRAPEGHRDATVLRDAEPAQRERVDIVECQAARWRRLNA
jgi:hypothetical protein